MSKDIVQMTIRLEPDFHSECKELSDFNGQTLGEWIRRAMKEKLERDSEKTAAPAAAENVSRAQYDALAGQVEQLKETVDALELYIKATRKIEPENSGKNNTKKRGQKP